MAGSATKIEDLINREYEAGFYTDIESDAIPLGLSEDVIRLISAKKQEPEFMLEWRLKAYRHWPTMKEPSWQNVHYPPIDYQDISYYSAPKSKSDAPKTLDEVDPELLRTYEKLGIPMQERELLAGVAVDAVFDSVSVATTFKAKLAEKGIIFCSFSEAVHEHPDLVKKYLGSVVPYNDNFFAALNSAVFSDGSFCYIPSGVRCPMELSTYFRINAAKTGQFERTLIVAEEDSYVSYLEGCTAPMRDENQLHAAVVELVALEDAQIKYSTVQNWYPGDKDGKGGIYNFVTKRGTCFGANSKISWTQVETGSAITWKYPGVILKGDNSVGEFYSVALTNNFQQADTGTKMIHIGKNTRSTILSKAISAGHGQNSYRGLVKIMKGATGARNYTQCDSLLIGDQCGAHTFPYMEVRNDTAQVEHEATTSKIGEDQLFYCMQRGLSAEDAVSMIVSGFCKQVFKRAADGVRRRGAEAARRQPGGQRRLDTTGRRRRAPRTSPTRREKHSMAKQQPILEIENLHASVGGKRDPARHRPDGLRRARCTRSWGRTARARARWPTSWPGASRLRGDRRSRPVRRQGPAGDAPRGAGARRRLPRLPVPGRDPRRQQHLLPAHGAERAAQAPRPRAARRDGFPRPGQGEDEVRRHGPDAHEPVRERGLLRRREEAQRDPADGGARPQARHPRRDRLRLSTSTPCASSPTASTRCARRTTR